MSINENHVLLLVSYWRVSQIIDCFHAASVLVHYVRLTSGSPVLRCAVEMWTSISNTSLQETVHGRPWTPLALPPRETPPPFLVFPACSSLRRARVNFKVKC